MEQKRYFWLKLQHDFFASKRIKKLRSIAGGDTYLIIYLKMQLLSIKTDGILTYTGLEKDFASELALDLDESPDDVAVTLTFLRSAGLIETSDEIDFLLPYARENTGSETAVAGRMRDLRARRNIAAIESERNNVRTLCEHRNGEIEKEKELEIDTPPIVPPKGCCDDEMFNAFWSAYPKKVGKGDAQKAWNKIRPSETLFAEIMDGLTAIKCSAQWTRDGGQYIPNPSTWLNQRRWEDDPNAGNMVGGANHPKHDEIPQTYDSAEFYRKALERSYGGKKDGG